MNTENTSLRLQEAAAKCLSSLDAWNKDLNNETARDTLLESVHELRKVTSRLEIDIAMNDRQVTNAKPLPLPEHKSKMERNKVKPLSEILPVAELRDKREKRKIAIQQQAEEDGADEDGADLQDGVDHDDEDMQPQAQDKSKPRRRRRPSSSDGSQSGNGSGDQKPRRARRSKTDAGQE